MPRPAWCTSSESGPSGRSAPPSSRSPPRKDPPRCFEPPLFPRPSCRPSPRSIGLGRPLLPGRRKTRGYGSPRDPGFLPLRRGAWRRALRGVGYGGGFDGWWWLGSPVCSVEWWKRSRKTGTPCRSRDDDRGASDLRFCIDLPTAKKKLLHWSFIYENKKYLRHIRNLCRVMYERCIKCLWNSWI